MKRFLGSLIVVSGSIALAGCMTVIPAPGSAQVRLTQNPADVAACSSVGNVHVAPDDQNVYAEATFRNLVVGAGGNTGLVTKTNEGLLVDGIAYRCPAGKPTGGG